MQIKKIWLILLMLPLFSPAYGMKTHERELTLAEKCEKKLHDELEPEPCNPYIYIRGIITAGAAALSKRKKLHNLFFSDHHAKRD